MIRKVFIDTWGWYAFSDANDANHAAVKGEFEILLLDADLYTSTAVIQETVRWCAERVRRYSRISEDLALNPGAVR